MKDAVENVYCVQLVMFTQKKVFSRNTHRNLKIEFFLEPLVDSPDISYQNQVIRLQPKYLGKVTKLDEDSIKTGVIRANMEEV